MEQQTLYDKWELQELANKLFMYTDSRDWQKLQAEVFAANVWFDMQSAGGGAPENKTAQDICALWQNGLEGLDAVHHQAGHYLINVQNADAEIYAYAIATHFKKDALKGTTRTFVGSYNLKATRTAQGWRFTAFQYNLTYVEGNSTLE